MNSVVSIPVAKRTQNKVIGEFYPLQKDELMALRKAKLINNAAYVHLALRTENPFCDRPVEIRPKEFAKRWQIPEVSVYKAIAKLKDLCILAIKAGKIIVEWILKPKAEQLSIPLSDEKPSKKQSTSDEPSFKTEPIADPWDDEPPKNFDYQNGKKIIKFDNELSDRKEDYQIRKNRGLKSLSDIGSELSQTLQTDQTNQTAEEKNFCTNSRVSQNECVNSEESKTVSYSDETKAVEVENVPRDVTHKKAKIISPSKSDATPRRRKTQGNAHQDSFALPTDLAEKLRELGIPLDKRVLDAIASHDISQAYSAAAHVENTWETINNPKSVFLFQLPQQPIEKLGSRLPEVGKQLREQYEAIEEERKDPEYQKKSSDCFARIREILRQKKKK